MLLFMYHEWSKYNYGVLVLLNHLSEIKARQGNIVAGSAKLANICQKYRNIDRIILTMVKIPFDEK